MLFAHKHDLPDVVGVVCVDVRDSWSDLFQLGLIRVLDQLLQFRENRVQPLHRLAPALAVETVEGLVVVSVVVCLLLACQLLELPLVPKHQMIGKLSHRMIPFAVRPARLSRRQPRNCYIRAHKPFAFVVCAAQLVQQDALESRRLLLLCQRGNRHCQHRDHE